MFVPNREAKKEKPDNDGIHHGHHPEDVVAVVEVQLLAISSMARELRGSCRSSSRRLLSLSARGETRIGTR